MNAELEFKDEEVTKYLKMADDILQHDFGEIDPLSPDTMSEIIPSFLWLGNRKDANRISRLRDTGITHVLNCAKQCKANEQYEDLGITLHKVDAMDVNDYDIIGLHAQECIDFINQCIEQTDGKVLVHCVGGVNRSASLVTAYLISPQGMDLHFLEAIEYIARRRDSILLNKSFRIQLIKYARSMDKLIEYQIEPKRKERSIGCSCCVL